MPHTIDQTTGKAAVFVTGEPAWHRLGKVIESAATSAEAIKLAGLDWNIEQWPLTAFNPDSSDRAAVPTRVANVRTDTKSVLGVVSPDYSVFQNAEAFDFMDDLVGEKLAMYETAGSLHGGRRVWMMARIPKEYRVGPEDLVHPYVLLANSHDGTSALRMIPTTVRVVCQNTLNLALRYGYSEGLTVRHYSGLDKRVEEARKNLGIISKRFDAFEKETEALTATTITEAEAKGYFHSLLSEPANLSGKSEFEQLIGSDAKAEARDARKLEHDRELIDTWLANWENERNSLLGIRHTPWAAYNAVSEWADHDKTVRGKSESEKLNARLSSNWFGPSNAMKQDAYAKALELVKN